MRTSTKTGKGPQENPFWESKTRASQHVNTIITFYPRYGYWRSGVCTETRTRLTSGETAAMYNTKTRSGGVGRSGTTTMSMTLP